MKLKSILGLVSLTMLALGSCVKDYSCTCVSTYQGQSFTAPSTTIHDNKKDAKATCDQGSLSIGTATVTCTLK